MSVSPTPATNHPWCAVPTAPSIAIRPIRRPSASRPISQREVASWDAETDVLVVVDSLRPYLVLWQAVCKALSDANIAVGAEEEGSQQRSYYSRLVERAARRKERKEDEGSAAGGGSVTLLLLQPSVSVLPTAGERKEAYTLADFESGGFTKTVCSRVKMLEDKV